MFGERVRRGTVIGSIAAVISLIAGIYFGYRELYPSQEVPPGSMNSRNIGNDDDEHYAAGATVTVSILQETQASPIDDVTVSFGHPRRITVNLPGSVSDGEYALVIRCNTSSYSAYPVDVALGNAALSA